MWSQRESKAVFLVSQLNLEVTSAIELVCIKNTPLQLSKAWSFKSKNLLSGTSNKLKSFATWYYESPTVKYFEILIVKWDNICPKHDSFRDEIAKINSRGVKVAQSV